MFNIYKKKRTDVEFNIYKKKRTDVENWVIDSKLCKKCSFNQETIYFQSFKDNELY